MNTSDTHNQKGNNQRQPYRRLAAVLFADIVGFTELSATDEVKSLERVEFFEQAVREAAAKNDGTVVKFMGDGTLAHFPSTASAVQAALLMKKLFAQNTKIKIPPVRVGIHVGDILIREDDDVFGEGVNIASRLESLAKTGEIIISEEAWKHLRHNSEYKFIERGSHQLKGIPEKMKAYAVLAADESLRTSSKAAKKPVQFSAKKVTLSFGLLALAVLGVLLYTTKMSAEKFTQINSLVVLPFDNLTGNPDEEYLVAGMHDAIIGELTELGSLRVISRTSAIRYRNTSLSLAQIAEELNVDAVIAASVLRSGDNIRIRGELIRVFPQEESLWAGTIDREFKDVLALYSDMAQSVTNAIHLTLSPDVTARMARTKTVNPEAYRAYLKGRFHWEFHTSTDFNMALHYFETALAHDSEYAPAYGGIAAVWYGRRQRGDAVPAIANQKTTEAAIRALELDPQLASAWVALAVEAAWYDWDWEKAEEYFLKAIEYNPGDALSRSFYSLVLRITGRLEESKTVSDYAATLDPFHPIVKTISASNYMYLNDPERAISIYKSILEYSPSHPVVLIDIASIYHIIGRYEESYQSYRTYYDSVNDQTMVQTLDKGYQSGGYRQAMQNAADEFLKRRESAYVPASNIAMFLIRAERYEDALDWMEVMLKDRHPGIAYLLHPLFDPIRDHPRFLKILEAGNQLEYARESVLLSMHQ